MVEIPEKVRRLIKKEDVLVVGSASKSSIPNVSPRTAFYVDKDSSIYWIELFKHKSYRNLQKNPWCSIAVFDKKELRGYQMKGKASIVNDKKLKTLW